MAKAVKRFQYQQRDASTVKARATQRGGDFDSIFKEGIKLFKPREGKNKIRIMPPSWAGATHYGYEIFVNYGVGVDEQQYLSLSAMKNEPDPLAEARKQAEKQGNKALADSLKPTKRVLFYVIDRMAEDEGVQLWAAPWTVDKSFASLAIDEETGAVTMVDHPDEGYDITFYKEGTGLATKYPAERMRIGREPCPISEDQGMSDEWLDQISSMPIPDILNFYDYEHISAAFDGQIRNDKTSGKGKNKPEDEEPAKPATKPRTTRLPQIDPDEEFDEETGVISKKTGKVSSNPDPEDEADDPAPRMSGSSIRDRLASRRSRSSED